MTPSGTRGALNNAPSIYFADATLANALRRPVVHRRQGGSYRRRVPGEGEDDPVPRLGATMHRTP
jgi:hypothetical protein